MFMHYRKHNFYNMPVETTIMSIYNNNANNFPYDDNDTGTIYQLVKHVYCIPHTI